RKSPCVPGPLFAGCAIGKARRQSGCGARVPRFAGIGPELWHGPASTQPSCSLRMTRFLSRLITSQITFRSQPGWGLAHYNLCFAAEPRPDPYVPDPLGNEMKVTR